MGSTARAITVSDVSDEEEYHARAASSSEEEGECVDMSNPKAHGKKALGRKPQRKLAERNMDSSDSELSDEPMPKVSRNKEEAVDDLSDLSDEDDEPLPELPSGRLKPINLEVSDISDDDEPLPVASKLPSQPRLQLSKWASRFLHPRAAAPVIEEPELEPMNDFILSDFTTRFRGATEVKESQEDNAELSDGEPSADNLRIGRPVASVSPPRERPAKKAKISEDKDSKPRRAESRYFRKDLATKCYNCGEIGHMSNACVNASVMRPCFLCGYRDHHAGACPAVLCYRCNQPGHESRNCGNRREHLDYCKKCGGDHYADVCKVGNDGLKDISCMVCFEPGHLHCVPFPRPTNRRVYCPKCAGAHFIEECDEDYDSRRDYSSSARPSYRPSPTSSYDRRKDQTCYECGEVGHIAAMCPLKTRRHKRFDDEDSGPSRNSRVGKGKPTNSNNSNTSHKRKRDEANSMSYAKKYFARR
ncbi:hypothetical protein ACHHYP_10049 [Achlya hypogyna]|uniref:CCHC-type domain-containing protein n=1 Tax=Achlya hypogyna TaxID=1202772 RepID=A0A1V9ZIL3_ACHHY|nr:hypothetical protein ACHHYP_10049 [Achlya hypogyna]